MDFLLGDIVEKEVSAPEPPSFPINREGVTGGFPKPQPKSKKSAWKTKQERKKKEEEEEEQPVKKTMIKDGYEVDEDTGMKRLPKEKQKMDYEGMTEAEKIHMENIEILSKMSDEQRLREKEELLGTMNPAILQKLLRRTEKKMEQLTGKKEEPSSAAFPTPTPGGVEFEGYGEWIGGGRNGQTPAPWEEPTLDDHTVNDALGIKPVIKKKTSQSESGSSISSSDKKVRFNEVSTVKYQDEDDREQDPEWEDIENLDEIAPDSYQIVQEANDVPLEKAMNSVHFPRGPSVPEEEEELNINDPDFNEKLHEKYFPDLPKDTEKLKWMEPMPEIDTKDLVFDNVADLRFDFKGNLMVPGKNSTINTSEGLHHHSDNAPLAGYTLKELAHLSRSTLSGQRCIAIRTLGRILHKLGKGTYNIVPEFVSEEDGQPVEPDDAAVKRASTEFDQMFWGLIDELRIIESLEEAADELTTRNLSVRSYATEALWFWRQGGGNTRHAN